MNDRRYARVLHAVAARPWAIQKNMLGVIVEVLALRAGGERFDDAEIRERVGAAQKRLPSTQASSVAVIPLHGVIMPRASLFTEVSGATSVQGFQEMLRTALGDDTIGSIVLDVDSPGGSVDLVPEAAEELRNARGQKPIVAVANTLMASAAYHVGSQASELVVTPSGMVGSIGVYTVHEDVSVAAEASGVGVTFVDAPEGGHKVEGNPFEPLSEDARAELQRMVNYVYAGFVADVAKGRRVSQTVVKQDFGQGRVLQAKPALAAGMVDGIETFDSVVARLVDGARAKRRGARSSEWLELVEEYSDRQERVAAVSIERALERDALWGSDSLDVPELKLGREFSLGRLEWSGSSSAASAGSADRAVKTESHEPDRSGMDDEMNIEEATETPVEAAPEEPEAPVVAATPRADSPELGDVKSQVKELTEAVREMKANGGNADREKIDRMYEDLRELRKALPKEGYQVPDADGNDASQRRGVPVAPIARAEYLLSRPAAKVAVMARIDPDTVAEFHEKADHLQLLAAAVNKPPRELQYYEEEFVPAFHAALNTQNEGEGADWVPEEMSRTLIDRVNLDLVVAALFPTITMPRGTFKIPGYGLTRQHVGRHLEQTTDTNQVGFRRVQLVTRSILLEAKKFAGEMLVSKEEEEESIVPILPLMEDQLVEFIVADVEDCLINGDTEGDIDDDITDTSPNGDDRLNWDGLRKIAKIGGTTVLDQGGGPLDFPATRAVRRVMGKYGIRPGNLVHITSGAGYIDVLGDERLLTIDKYGTNATIISGELAKIDGSPLVISEYVRTDLDAAGEHGPNGDTTEMISVYPRAFIVGDRRRITTQRLVELYARFDQDSVIASCRKAFAPIYPIETEPIVSVTTNIGTSTT